MYNIYYTYKAIVLDGKLVLAKTFTKTISLSLQKLRHIYFGGILIGMQPIYFGGILIDL